MRIVPCLFLFLLLLLPACGQSTDSPEGMGKALAEMLRDGDQQAFMETLYVTDADLDCMVEHGDSSVRKEVERLRESGEFQEMIREGQAGWVKTRKRGAEKGVDWSNVEYRGVEYESRVKKGLDFADIYVVLRDGDKLWTVRLDDCIKCGDRWFSTDDLRFEGRAD